MGMPSAPVLAADIEARSTWRADVRHKIEGQDSPFVRLERRVVAGPHRGRKIACLIDFTYFFRGDVDYEAALARMLARAESSFADCLARGDDRDTDTPAA